MRIPEGPGSGVDPSIAARRAEEARRAAEAARQAELARQAALAQQAQQAQQSQQRFRSSFDAAAPQPKAPRLDANTPAASNLLTENTRDGQENCLDVAAEWLDLASPEIRGRSELVFLKDNRPDTEGQSGHVVIRQGSKVYDPTTKKSYDSMEAFQKEQPHYQPVGSIPGGQAKKILDAPPGSPERARAIEKAKVSPELQAMMVADPGRPESGSADPVKHATDLKNAANELRETANALAGEAQRVPSPPNKEAAKEAAAKAEEAEKAANVAASQAGLEPPFPRLLNLKSATQATDDYKQLKKLPPEGQVHRMKELLQQHAQDPDYTAQLVDLARKEGDNGLLQRLGEKLFSYQHQAGSYRGTEAERRLLVDALKTAREAGTFSDVDLNSYRNTGVASSSPWSDIAEQLNVQKTDRTDKAGDLVGDVKGATQEYEDAAAAAKKKDEELFKQLSSLGNTLTEEQKKAYIKAFQEHPDYKKAYEKKAQAAEKLAQTLQKDPEALKNALASGTGNVADIRKALNLLADSPKGLTAAEVANEILKDPASPAARALTGGDPNFVKDLAAKAMEKSAAEYLAGAEDPKDAFAKFVEGMDKFKPLLDAAGGYDQAKFAASQFENAVEFDKYSDLQKYALQWEAKSPLFKSIAVVGLMFAGASAAESARNAGEEGVPALESYGKALKDIASASKGGLDLTAQLTATLTGAGRDAAATGTKAAKFASFAGRLSPVLGLAASTTSLVLRVKSARDDPDAGKYISIIGDTLGVLGGSLELAGPAALVGAVISGAGAVISAGGELVTNYLDTKEQQQQKREFLEKAGIKDKALREALVLTGSKQAKLLTDELGLSAEQLQTLATKAPLLVVGAEAGPFADMTQFTRMLKDHGLKGDAAYKALDALVSNAKDPVTALSTLVATAQQEGHHVKQKENWGHLLDRAREKAPAEERASIDAFRKALGY
ncbi:hypothetical protein HPC49_02475 [Pyxidicoccus fallax]|uniref:Uncharacterized protein n=1 Tax=Pyxidicoccus fallax TaxID=394095 RepID=A0A848LBU6_9BACT|nr:hypothetical protein [Pyxidicoccus fallax]NMO15712.1 hypothetical protein [Pyxidicoccus fallax]NPC77119.1 hypothetical protein [Pyxidicoccus fallax]